MRRLLLLCGIIWVGLLGASTGPGTPPPTGLTELLKDLPLPVDTLAQAKEVPHYDFPATPAEQMALRAAFAAPPVLSETGDDLRKVAAFTEEIRKQVDTARAIINMVKDRARQLDNLVDAQLANLPLGIKQSIGNTDVFIAIAEARLTPSAAMVDILVSLDLPDTDQDPIFVAKNIGWSRRGGFVGNIELELIADWGIDFNAGRSRLILRADGGETNGGTFVTINCDGFVAGRVNATVLFSRNWVIPVINGEPLTDELLGGPSSEEIYSDERVQADFAIDIDLEEGFDFLAEMAVPMPFVFKGKEQVEVSIGLMAIDLSDVANPSGLVAPSNYVSAHGNGPGALAPTWQGFYLAGLEVKLPDKLSKNGGPPPEIGAPYLIIDKMGITVHLYATELLPLGEKSADGWAFSVDRLDLKITANAFEEAGIQGKVNIPLLASAAESCGGSAEDVPPNTLTAADCLLYDAVFIAGGDIYFTIESQENYCADLWKATVEIEANSKLMLALEDGQFNASALLFGTIGIDARINDNFGLVMDDLSFDSLILSNRPQYFSSGLWDFPDNITAEFGAFSLGFEHISMALDPTSEHTDGRDVALSFQAWFNLDSSLDVDIAGSFELLGTLNEEDDRQKWRFKRLKVNAISFYASTDAWALGATIAFYENDAEWGTGFYGSGDLFLTMVGGDVGIAAVAQFGTAPNGEDKYFFVDVIARFGAGILLPGGIKLMAIGGGVYTNMSRVDGGVIQSFVDPDDGPIDDAANAVDEFADWDGQGASPLNGLVGVSTSGVEYQVDLGNRFGAFLQVVIAGPSPEAFSVNARLELIVEDSGAWQARIDGNIMIMAPVNYTNDYRIEEGVGIFVNMAYTHSESYKGFQASADVFVNVGGGLIRGGNDGAPPLSGPGTNKGEYVASSLNYAGGISLEFSTETWYVHIGYPTPDRRINLDVTVGPVSVEFTSYFCIGQLVPPIPNLPPEVTAIAGDLDLSRDFAQYANASGFAFGSSLSLASAGKFLIFYYELTAGIGFDINIRKYGDAICAGGGSNAPAIGINGWYAAGQAWAYATGEIGIDVKLLFVTVRKEILSAGVAAVLQLKGPNPTWARGTFAGYYSILGGVIRGNFNVQAEFGDNCVITGRGGNDPFAEVEIMSQLIPDDNAEEIAVGTIPTAYLIMPLNEKTELGAKEYRTRWLETRLRKVSNGSNVPGTVVKDDSTYVIQFIPDEFLEGETEYEIKMRIKLESRSVGGGSWSQVKEEVKEHTFTTAPAGERLEPGNIAYSYPLDGMANFYRLEYGSGYLKLKRTQPTLTDDITVVYSRAGTSQFAAREATYADDEQEYTWQHPYMLTDKLYKIEFVQGYEVVTTGGGGGTDPNPPGQDGQNMPTGDDGQNSGGGPNASGSAPATAAGYTGTVIHTLYFRSSQYNRFTDKIDALAETFSTVGNGALPNLAYTGEFIDLTEIMGNGQTEGGLISARMLPEETYLTSSTIQERILDEMPFNFSSSVVDYQDWNNLEIDLPYDGNVFKFANQDNPVPLVGPDNFANEAVDGSGDGGRFFLGFVHTAREIGLQLSGDAKWAVTAIVGDLIYDQFGLSAMGCFTSEQLTDISNFHASFETNGTIDNPNGPNLETCRLFASTLVPDMLETGVGNFCPIPSKLMEMARMREDIGIFSISNDDYPVRFTYTLPGEKHAVSVTKTISL